MSHRLHILVDALSMHNLSFLLLQLFITIRLLQLPEAHIGFPWVAQILVITTNLRLILLRTDLQDFDHNSSQFDSLSSLEIKGIWLIWTYLRFLHDEPQFIDVVLIFVFLFDYCLVWLQLVYLMFLMEDWVDAIFGQERLIGAEAA